MPIYFFGVLLAITAFSLAFFLWFAVSTRNKREAFNTLMANPEQIAQFWRTGEDGDGYDRLNVRTKNGAVLVIGHFEADVAERCLFAICANKALAAPTVPRVARII